MLTAVLLAAVLQVPAVDRVPGPRVDGAAASESTLREEFFLLESVSGGPATGAMNALSAMDADVRVIGVAALRRRDVSGARTLELDVRFPFGDRGAAGESLGASDRADDDGGARVLHVELETPAGPKLVWREWEADRGRTLILEPDGEQRWHTLEWGGSEPVRGELQGPTRFTLELLEELRASGAAASESGPADRGASADAESTVGRREYRVFDPLSRRIETLHLRPAPVSSEARPASAPGTSATGVPATAAETRSLELLRADGSVAAAYRFEGELLTAFQWQAGGLRARRVGAVEYRRQLADAGNARGDD